MVGVVKYQARSLGRSAFAAVKQASFASDRALHGRDPFVETSWSEEGHVRREAEA